MAKHFCVLIEIFFISDAKKSLMNVKTLEFVEQPASIFRSFVLFYWRISLKLAIRHRQAQQEEQQQNNVVDDGTLLRIRNFVQNSPQRTWQFIQAALDGLGTPKGAMVIACAYGLTQCVSNFLWAFNWHEHANSSEDTHAIIQEIGGLTSAAENLLLGVLVPIMLYEYNKHVREQEQGDQ